MNRKNIPKILLSTARTRRFWLTIAVIAMASLAFGCAISDYRGYLEHHTESEAKLFGSEIAFSGTGDAQLDGTYSYTVKYDFRGTGTTPPTGTYPAIDINTYRNPVFAAFSRDGCVDRDGDEIQGRAGSANPLCDPAIPAGKFSRQWIYVDTNAGCQFDANFKQSFTQPKTLPPILLCSDSPSEEIDKDLDLQDSFASLDDLMGKIWSGAIRGGLTLAVTSVELDGRVVPLSNRFSFPVATNSIRPRNAAFDVSTPGGQELIRAILNNTVNKQPVSIAINFDGGMRIALPVAGRIAFNHDALIKLLH
jgi:hypothetical protein